MRNDLANCKWMAPVLALTVSLAAASCDNGDVVVPDDGMAEVSVYLTDAPGDVEAVWLEIVEIYLQGGDDGRADLLGEPTDLVLLTDLVGTTQLLVADAAVDPALYGQLRLVVGDAILLSSEGTVYVKGDPEIPAELADAPMGELMCPSCSQSGLKITIPNTEANDEVPVEEGALAFIVDFNVAESFGHRAGNSGRWNMHPVMHGTMVEDTNGDGSILDELGSVSAVTGTVELASTVEIPECPAGTPRSIQDFIPTAEAHTLVGLEGPIVRSGSVGEDGSFVISFLAADTYTLGYVNALDLAEWDLVFSASVSPEEASVTDGDVEGVVYTIQGADCVAG